MCTVRISIYTIISARNKSYKIPFLVVRHITVGIIYFSGRQWASQVFPDKLIDTKYHSRFSSNQNASEPNKQPQFTRFRTLILLIIVSFLKSELVSVSTVRNKQKVLFVTTTFYYQHVPHVTLSMCTTHSTTNVYRTFHHLSVPYYYIPLLVSTSHSVNFLIGVSRYILGRRKYDSRCA